MSIKLRGGAETNDPRLDRVYPGLERHMPSLNYLALNRLIALDKPARSFTYNFRLYDPKLDQGVDGACVGFGWANELACYPAMVFGVDNRFAKEEIYWPAQREDGWEGGSYPGAEPFYEGTSVLAGAGIVKNDLRLIGGYDWYLTLDEMIQGVGLLGPTVMGTDWYAGMFNVDSAGFVHPTGQVVGGHCWMIRGINLKQRYFLARNSWGSEWGMNGDFKISFDDVGMLLEAQGEACVPRLRSMKPRT